MVKEIIFSVLLLLLGIVLIADILHKGKERKHMMSFMEGLDLTGFPIVTMVNNGMKFNFVLDTGSVHNLINQQALENMVFEKTDYSATISGIENQAREEENVVKMRLTYKDKTTEGLFVATDLRDVFASVRKETGVQLHGLLGSDFFKENRYIIDYNEMVAYSKRI